MTPESSAYDLAIGSTSTVGQRIAANAGLMVGAKLLAAVLGLGTLVVTKQALDDNVLFGTVIFIHAYMLFFSEVGAFQSWQVIIKFGTDDVERGDVGALARLVKFGVKLDLMSAVGSTLLAIGLFGFVSWVQQFVPLPEGRGERLPPGEVQLYTSLYCLLILFRQRGASIGIFRLFDKFSVLAVKALIMPVLRFAGALLAWQLGWGVVGFLCVWFFASWAGYIYLPIMGVLELKRRGLLGEVIRAKVSLLRPRAGVWPFAITSNVDSTLAAANLHMPVLLVTAVLGPAVGGIYKIAEEVAKLLSEGFRLLDQVIYPELARMVADGRLAEIWRLVRRAAVILLSFGVAMSLLVLWVGPEPLVRVFGEDFRIASPIASILVPAAALMGIVAPLYPVMYAAGKPERALYARAAGVAVYVVAFFVLSYAYGVLGAASAVVIGNLVSAVWAVWTARRTLRQAQAGGEDVADALPAPDVEVVGESGARIWGLGMAEWQRRTFRKAGAIGKGADTIYIDADVALSPNLVRALVATPERALVDESGRVVAVRTEGEGAGLIGGADTGEVPRVDADGLAGGYDVALRRMEAPYLLDMRRDDPEEVMRRQFASSYKGITDFVTKWVWPWPAYHVTRWCADRGLTPNQVTSVGFVLCVVAFFAFWSGQWWLGFASGWVMTFLDTVDGKLARTTMTYSKWGNVYDHGIDLIHPPFWYWAWWHGLGVSLAAQGLELPDWALWALMAILVGYWVDRIVEGLFIAQFGMHIHVWTRFNSALRFVIARRNPNTFIFMLGIIATVAHPMAGVWAFGAVAAWTWTCIGLSAVSLLAAQFARKPLTSWMRA